MKLTHLYKFDWYAPHQAWLAEQGFSHHDPRGAKPKRASLYRPSLTGANLHRANLLGANLYGADLTWANLGRAILEGANLDGATMVGANLGGANLNGASLLWVIGNGKEIKTIQTDKWPIVLTKDTMAIGCEQHSIEEWMSFDDAQINEMDASALEWSRTWRPVIEQIIKVNAA